MSRILVVNLLTKHPLSGYIWVMHKGRGAMISVITHFNHKTGCTTPVKILWNREIKNITKIGMHHTFKKGDTLFHVFSVCSNNMFFKLVFNSENLQWELEQVTDTMSH